MTTSRYNQKSWIGEEKEVAYLSDAKSQQRLMTGESHRSTDLWQGYAMFEITREEANRAAPEVKQTLDDLARDGVRRMIAAALKAEVDDYVDRMQGERDEQGHALVARSGKAQQRTLTTGAGPIKIQGPRVHDRRPGQRHASQILPPYMRRSPRLEEVLPALYLRGLSTSDFA